MGIFVFPDLSNSQSSSLEKYSQWTVAVEIYIKLQAMFLVSLLPARPYFNVKFELDVHSSVKPLIFLL